MDVSLGISDFLSALPEAAKKTILKRTAKKTNGRAMIVAKPRNKRDSDKEALSAVLMLSVVEFWEVIGFQKSGGRNQESAHALSRGIGD